MIIASDWLPLAGWGWPCSWGCDLPIAYGSSIHVSPWPVVMHPASHATGISRVLHSPRDVINDVLGMLCHSHSSKYLVHWYQHIVKLQFSTIIMNIHQPGFPIVFNILFAIMKHHFEPFWTRYGNSPRICEVCLPRCELLHSEWSFHLGPRRWSPSGCSFPPQLWWAFRCSHESCVGLSMFFQIWCSFSILRMATLKPSALFGESQLGRDQQSWARTRARGRRNPGVV